MSAAPAGLRPARLRLGDVLSVGASGLRTRTLRVFLAALGIAIGIAAMVAVIGVSTSSRAELDLTLTRLGTNLLRVAPGERIATGDPVPLPVESVAMVGRIGPVTSVAAIGAVAGAAVYRNDHVPVGQTGAIQVAASTLDLRDTVGVTIASGAWFNEATASYPTVVLGATAAQRLAVSRAGSTSQVWLGRRWFTVIGIMDPVPLAPELDTSALVGWPAARTYLGYDEHPTTVYCRMPDDKVDAVRGVLAATANPGAPQGVRVSRPSDALVAKQAFDRTFAGLLLGLGAVALLVGGLGVANTMVISVLERRAEIGLRRSLGATPGQIRLQFLVEALLLAGLGGAGGVGLGVLVTAVYATGRHWPTVVPPAASAGALVAAVVIGTMAGGYPAHRAARLSPTEALG